MKNSKKLIGTLTLLGGIVASISTVHAENVIQSSLVMDQSLVVDYQGRGATNLEQKGFIQDFGSALTLKKIHSDGSIDFIGITDRGPNADSPQVKLADGKLYSSKLFPTPDFHPSTALIRLYPNGETKIIKQNYIKNSDGTFVTGLPHPFGTEGDSQEVPLTINQDGSLSLLNKTDVNGLDPEGVAVDSSGNTWISDEYGPYVVKLNKGHVIQTKLSPGNGLPSIFSKRIPNRGLENLTILPNGNVLAVMQSVLDVDGSNGKQENSTLFIRIAEIDSKTNKTIHTYAYPITSGLWSKAKDCKLGDIYPIDDTRFLIIEQGTDKNKKAQKLIYQVDLSKATDITNKTIDGLSEKVDGANALEMTKDLTTLTNLGVQMASKTLVTDLAAVGYVHDKAEGLVLLPDGKTLVIINDNDFVFTMIDTTNTTNLDIQSDYTFDATTGITSKKGTNESPVFDLVPNDPTNQNVELIRYTLPTSLDQVAPTISGIENGSKVKHHVTLTVLDNLKGSKPAIRVLKDGKPIQTPKKLTFKEPGKYTITAKDLSNNESTCSFEIVHSSGKK